MAYTALLSSANKSKTVTTSHEEYLSQFMHPQMMCMDGVAKLFKDKIIPLVKVTWAVSN
jgi:hypothetical protein